MSLLAIIIMVRNKSRLQSSKYFAFVFKIHIYVNKDKFNGRYYFGVSIALNQSLNSFVVLIERLETTKDVYKCWSKLSTKMIDLAYHPAKGPDKELKVRQRLVR